jgi:hypothetical protein
MEKNDDLKGIEGLIDYLKKTSKGKHKEYRLVVTTNGNSYIHVFNEDSETYDFSIKKEDN